VLADLINLHDVRVREAGHRLRLAGHAGAHRRLVEQLPTDQLERHLAVEAAVVTRVHDAHRALAELVEHDEGADRGRIGADVGHAPPHSIFPLWISPPDANEVPQAGMSHRCSAPDGARCRR
jgi:hypothetical protein